MQVTKQKPDMNLTLMMILPSTDNLEYNINS
jgi:hypothetical protein